MSANSPAPSQLSAATLGKLQDIEARVAVIGARIRAATQRRQTEGDTDSERMAQAARSGELGPAWRVIQHRIDLGQTTLAAVFSGQDRSAEAEMLRQTARQHLRDQRTQWARELEEGGGPNPLSILAAGRLEFDEHMEQAQRNAREERP